MLIYSYIYIYIYEYIPIELLIKLSIKLPIYEMPRISPMSPGAVEVQVQRHVIHYD